MVASKKVLFCGDCNKVLGKHSRCGHPEHEHILVDAGEGTPEFTTPTGSGAIEGFPQISEEKARELGITFLTQQTIEDA